MASSQASEFQVNTARDALALLSRLAYEKFGEEALPLISEVCYKLGVSVGKKMKEDMSASCLKAAGEIFLGGAKKRGTPADILEISDKRFHSNSYRCSMGLANTNYKLCEAVMAMDRAILETASGKKLKLDIIKTIAAGDPCCDTIFTVVE